MLDVSVQVTHGTPVWEALTAIGTLGAVLVALFGPMLRAWWRSPSLEITYEPQEPYCRDTVLEPGNVRAHWVRVKVTNEGRGTAKRCKGKMNAVFRPDGGLRDDRDPMQLRWAGVPLEQSLEPLDLARRDSQFLTVVFARDDSREGAWIAADIRARPGFPYMLEAGQTHRVRLAVYADNADPVTKDFVITYGGDIRSLEMRLA